MAQRNLMADLLNRMKSANDQLENENERLKRVVEQLKLDAEQVKQKNERRISLLNDEVNNLKSCILGYSLQSTTSDSAEHVNKRICQYQTIEVVPFTDPQMKVDTNKSSITSLPSNVICSIIIRFPLRHRVLLRIICKQWKSIIEKMSGSVQFLKLFGPTKNSLNYNKEADRSRHNLLLIDMKREVEAPKYPKGITQIQFIPQLFCNVDQVVLSFPKTFEITIMQLLESWADRLTSLVLDIEVGDQYLGEAIWHRITQLSKLKSLTVYKYFKNSFNSQNNQLKFLGQLQELRIGQSVSNGDEIIRFISPNIERLEIGAYARDIFNEILNRQTVFVNVTHLVLVIDRITREQQQEMLQFVCRHFVSLIDLKLDCLHQFPFDQQLTHLSQLSHLTKLHLYMHVLTCANLDYNLSNSIYFSSLQFMLLNIWMTPMTPKQTKLRLINITERSRVKKFLNSIPTMFPVLVELKIVARSQLTIQSIGELVNGSNLKLCERIKCKLIEFL